MMPTDVTSSCSVSCAGGCSPAPFWAPNPLMALGSGGGATDMFAGRKKKNEVKFRRSSLHFSVDVDDIKALFPFNVRN